MEGCCELAEKPKKVIFRRTRMFLSKIKYKLVSWYHMHFVAGKANIKWAEHEIELACKRENPDWDGKSFDYGCSIYKNAFDAYKKAIKVIAKEGHSGMSHAFTISALVRLLNDKPLTMLTDDESEWVDISGLKTRGVVKQYANKRYHGLYKDVMEDGSVRYKDVNRVKHTSDGQHYYKGTLDSLVDSFLFPITMPYAPRSDEFVIRYDEGLSDDENGIYHVDYVMTPTGGRHEYNCKFKYLGNLKWERLD